MSMQTKSMNRLAPIDEAVKAAVRWLDAHQEPEGFWVGMIETNCCMEAEWLMASHILGIKLPMEDGLVRAILKGQRPDGAWETYPGATGGDINSTVESYVALRLKGLSPSDPVMTKARNWILQNGGLRKVRVFTRYWLAMLGIWPWQATPNVPPEVIRFPRWFPFNIYNFAQWARATFVPLTVISARRAVFPLPCGRLDELFPDGYENFDFYTPVKDADFLSLEWIFLKVDRILHALQNARLTPGRENAIKLCLEWVIKHQDADGAWGGIQPPWIYALIALHVEGYALDHPVLAKGISTLSDHWSYERDGVTHIQASESPVGHVARSARNARGGFSAQELAFHAEGARLGPAKTGRLARRLVDHGQEHSLGRLGVRTRQSLLPGHRRHRRRLAYVGKNSGQRRAGAPRADRDGDRTRGRLDACHAIALGRLGRLRQGQ